MSGRTRVLLPDGRVVRGYRKTLRQNLRQPVVVIRNAPPLAPDLPPDPPSVDYPVRLTFLLPDTVLVSPGPHGFNTAVLPGNVVRIRGREARHCFALARELFGPAFTCRATIRRDDDERTYRRHLTVVHGALVITGGLIEPRIFEA
jgi:hypothetical protein